MKKLADYISSKEKDFFEFGRNDCALFAAGAIEAITGNNPLSFVIGRYKTFRGGMRQLRKVGYQDHVDFFVQNYVEIPLSQARIGDVAVIETDDGPAICFCCGSFVACVAENGIERRSILDCQRAFRV